jgi:hypothetical protein
VHACVQPPGSLGTRRWTEMRGLMPFTQEFMPERGGDGGDGGRGRGASRERSARASDRIQTLSLTIQRAYPVGQRERKRGRESARTIKFSFSLPSHTHSHK